MPQTQPQFDPDAYLKRKALSMPQSAPGGGFDPDSYLKSKGIAAPAQVPEPESTPAWTPFGMVNVPKSVFQNLQGIAGEFKESARKLNDPNSSDVAAMAQAGNAALNATLSPLQAADAFARQEAGGGIPGRVVGAGLDVLGAIPTAAGYAAKKATEAQLGLIGAISPEWAKSQRAQQLREELPKLAGTTASIILPMKAGEIGDAARSLQQTRDLNFQAKGNSEFLKALPATKKEIGIQNDINIGRKFIADEFRENPLDKSKGAPGTVRQFYDRSRDVLQKIFNERMNPAVEHYGNEPIDVNTSVKQPILNTFTDVKKWAAPKKIQALTDYLKNDLPDQMTLKQARDFVTELNQETKGYRSASPQDQFKMFTADPTVAMKVDLADAVRESMLQKLSDLGEPKVGQFRKEYGAVAKMRDMAYRNIVGSERQQPRFLGGSSPAKTGMMLTGELMLMLHNPPAAIMGGVGALARDYVINRELKNPTLTRAIENWTKSSLKPEPYTFVAKGNVGGGAAQQATTPPSQQIPPTSGGGGGPVYARYSEETPTGITPGMENLPAIQRDISPATKENVSRVLKNRGYVNIGGKIADGKSLTAQEQSVAEKVWGDYQTQRQASLARVRQTREPAFNPESDIPEFKGSTEAVNYGRQNGHKAEDLQKRYEAKRDYVNGLIKQGKMNDASEFLQKNNISLDREAAEAARNPKEQTPIEKRQTQAEQSTIQAQSQPLSVEISGKRYPVASIEDASKRFSKTRDALDVGASQAPQAIIYQGNKPIGHISYNGNVWEGLPKDWNQNTNLLYGKRYEPKAVGQPESQPQPLIQSKIEEAAKAAPKAGLTLKEQKKTLVGELDRAISIVGDRAPGEIEAQLVKITGKPYDESMIEAQRIDNLANKTNKQREYVRKVKDFVEKNRDALNKEVSDRYAKKLKDAGFQLDEKGRVVIDIPGDGTFYTPIYSLELYRNEIQNKFPTTKEQLTSESRTQFASPFTGRFRVAKLRRGE